MSALLRCESCGGAVVYQVEAQAGACLFCGAKTLVVAPPEDAPPQAPDSWIPTAIDPAAARERFAAWAAASWWRPKTLRDARLDLNLVLIPAWRLGATLETHWAGLERAATRSGKRPVAGTAHITTHVLVPASGSLTQDEMFALQPYHEDQARPWPPVEGAPPQEPPQLSARAARARAHELMAAWHADRIRQEEGLLSCNVSPVFDDGELTLVAVPVHIGVFRFRGRPWRLLVNAQTGEVVGDAPIDRVKVALLTALVLAAAILAYLLASS